jgi:LysR family transcriptional regulator for bpeEF and oprC
MRTFVRVVDRGSFSAAARELGLGQSAVSKQVAALEEHVGAQLLVRNARRLALTEAGQEFHASCARILDEVEAACSRVGTGLAGPSGLVRLAVPPVFGQIHVVPRLHELLSRYPRLRVDMIVAEHPVDLGRDGVDVELRNLPYTDGSVVARVIASTDVVTVATPEYLAAHGEPRTPSELGRHACIAFISQGVAWPWRFRDRGGEIEHRPEGRLRTNDAEHVRAAVLADLGIAHAPAWLFHDELASGRVRRLLPAYERAPITISALHAGHRLTPAKVRAVVDFFAGAFADDPALTPRRTGRTQSKLPNALRRPDPGR